MANQIKKGTKFTSFKHFQRCFEAYCWENKVKFVTFDSHTVKSSKVKDLPANLKYYEIYYSCQFGKKKPGRATASQAETACPAWLELKTTPTKRHLQIKKFISRHEHHPETSSEDESESSSSPTSNGHMAASRRRRLISESEESEDTDAAEKEKDSHEKMETQVNSPKNDDDDDDEGDDGGDGGGVDDDGRNGEGAGEPDSGETAERAGSGICEESEHWNEIMDTEEDSPHAETASSGNSTVDASEAKRRDSAGTSSDSEDRTPRAFDSLTDDKKSKLLLILLLGRERAEEVQENRIKIKCPELKLTHLPHVLVEKNCEQETSIVQYLEERALTKFRRAIYRANLSAISKCRICRRQEDHASAKKQEIHLIQCDQCLSWYHQSCQRLPGDVSEPDGTWYCNDCMGMQL